MPDINMQVFKEAQRNQLVTEIDIQTQAALDDYQVKLSDIANPTQSQDNIVIDRFGKFLPHWNESLDFDTWVKMSMEISGKRLLMLRGNSSICSVSNGDDTFAQFANSDDAAKFSTLGITLSEVDGYLRFYNPTSSTHGAATYSNFTINSDQWILTTKHKMVSLGSADSGDFNTRDGGSTDRFHRIYAPLRTAQTVITIPLTPADTMAWTEGTEYIIKTIVDETDSSTGIDIYLYDKDGSFLDSSLNHAFLNGSPTEVNELLIGDQTTAGYCDIRLKYLHLRKYISTEPTWKANGGEQNIAVALKSLGRAG